MPSPILLPAAISPLPFERLHTLVENRTVYALEGFELNVLGLVTGFDFARPALKVPGVGRVPASE